MFIDLLLPSLGITFSPTTIIVLVVILGTKNPIRKGFAFTTGWVAGLLALTVAVLLGTDLIELADGERGTTVYWLYLLTGLFLVLYGFYTLSTLRKRAKEKKPPAWIQHLDTLGYPKLFAAGAAFAGLKPKNMAFVFAGITLIIEAGIALPFQILWGIYFVLMSSIAVVAVLTCYILIGERAEHTLMRIKSFLLTYNELILSVLFIIFGTIMIVNGLTGFGD